jgi:uncharacterized protein YhfF
METPLPDFELAHPGPLRDRLVAAALSGAKTATSSLRVFYELADEPLPQAGTRSILIGSDGERLAIIESIEVRQFRLCDVDDVIALAEGEGFAGAEEWRRDHEAFWREELALIPGGASIELSDETLVVVETFRVVPGPVTQG